MTAALTHTRVKQLDIAKIVQSSTQQNLIYAYDYDACGFYLKHER